MIWWRSECFDRSHKRLFWFIMNERFYEGQKVQADSEVVDNRPIQAAAGQGVFEGGIRCSEAGCQARFCDSVRGFEVALTHLCGGNGGRSGCAQRRSKHLSNCQAPNAGTHTLFSHNTSIKLFFLVNESSGETLTMLELENPKQLDTPYFSPFWGRSIEGPENRRGHHLDSHLTCKR